MEKIPSMPISHTTLQIPNFICFAFFPLLRLFLNIRPILTFLIGYMITWFKNLNMHVYRQSNISPSPDSVSPVLPPPQAPKQVCVHAKSLQSCPTLCRPHGLQLQAPRLPRPWDSPGKNTGVGCHFLLHPKQVIQGYWFLGYSSRASLDIK